MYPAEFEYFAPATVDEAHVLSLCEQLLSELDPKQVSAVEFLGRLQLRGVQSQTDLFAGRQLKFFGWPNLYPPFGFNESEYLKTELFILNHAGLDGDAGHAVQHTRADEVGPVVLGFLGRHARTER